MANPFPTGHAALLAAAALISVQLAAAQGVAVTGRTARQSSLAKTDLPLPKIQFEDVTEGAGLHFQHVLGQPEDKAYILETTGSGVAIFDFDNDGLPDIFLSMAEPGRTMTRKMSPGRQAGFFGISEICDSRTSPNHRG